MKNKKMTLYLLALVVVIWGIVIWRVIDFQDTPVAPLIKKQALIEANYKPKKRDAPKLLFEYNDPFLKDISVIEEVEKKEEGPVRVNRVRMWPSVEYNGAVSRHQSDVSRGMLRINQTSNLVSVGDIVSGIKVVFVSPDSIGLEFDCDVRFVKRYGYEFRK